MTDDDFKKSLPPCALDKMCLSMGRVNPFMPKLSYMKNENILENFKFLIIISPSNIYKMI